MRVTAIGLRGIPNVIGGIETHCEQLYPAIIAHDEAIDVHLYARRGYINGQANRFGKVWIHQIWAPSIRGGETLIHTLLCLIHARFILRPDIVHLHGIGPGFWALLARGLGFHVVVTHHAPDYRRPKWHFFARTLLKLGEMFSAYFAHHVICVSHSVETAFLERYPKAASRTSVISNAVQPFAHNDEACDRILGELGLAPQHYVVAVGRLEATKRFEDLIAAQGHVVENRLPLVIVGSAVDFDSYADRLKALDGFDVIFAGYRSGAQLGALYENAALFIHPSEMEGFGLVVLEALSANAPIALSDIPAHREFRLPADAYFPVGDIGAIARFLSGKDNQWLKAPDRTAILARFDLGTAARQHISLYRDLIGQATPALPA